MAGRLDTIGIDLVAMCANDVVCTGAEPLFFLDYLAVERVVPEEVARIVSGVAEGCRRAGCALLGGETAEHPGVMDPGRFDLAGFCVGVVEEAAVLDPSTVEEGDVLIGLPSTGLHSNGYSLVRRVVFDIAKLKIDEQVPELGGTVADALLEPTRIYVKPVRQVLANYRVKHVVQSAFNGKRIVIFSGGEAKDAGAIMEEVKGIKEGGGFGSIMGRNAFQRPKDEALKLLKDVMAVYQGK